MQISISLLLIFMAGMSFVLFAMMGIDKALAKRGAWRVPERTLFALALFGGALGGLIGMYLFRHKTRHTSFKAGLPILLGINVACCIALIAK